MQGQIKLLTVDKGFGFIKGEDGKEYFFHKSALKNVKFEALSKGQIVEFEDSESEKGLRAEDIFI